MSEGHVRHMDDGELIRLLDGECSAEEQARIARHVATCPVCAQRQEGLGGLANGVTAALVRGDEPVRSVRVPKRTWRIGAFRAAAVLLVVSVGVAAASAPPVRAWLSARWAELRGLVGSRSTSETAVAGATTVRFVPATSVFTIELAGQQDGGVLTIDLSPDSLASATVIRGRRIEEIVVLPERLRIVNQPGDRASYDVRLPSNVTEVRVRIADAPERRLIRGALATPWSIDLKKLKP